jgi:hypothetical protein
MSSQRGAARLERNQFVNLDGFVHRRCTLPEFLGLLEIRLLVGRRVLNPIIDHTAMSNRAIAWRMICCSMLVSDSVGAPFRWSGPSSPEGAGRTTRRT